MLFASSYVVLRHSSLMWCDPALHLNCIFFCVIIALSAYSVMSLGLSCRCHVVRCYVLLCLTRSVSVSACRLIRHLKLPHLLPARLCVRHGIACTRVGLLDPQWAHNKVQQFESSVRTSWAWTNYCCYSWACRALFNVSSVLSLMLVGCWWWSRDECCRGGCRAWSLWIDRKRLSLSALVVWAVPLSGVPKKSSEA